MEGEIWKDIVGFEYKYQISNLGRVKIKENVSMRMNMGKMRNYVQRELIMSNTFDGNYYKVGLVDERGKVKQIHIHRLLATHFIPNPNNLPQVNHIDGNKKNNDLSNLEWVTRSQNMKHAVDVLGFKPNTTGINPKRPVRQIDKSTGEIIKEYESIRVATEQTGIRHISCVCRGVRKSAGGYLWEYI